MLLVDHDQAEVADRREDGRAGADADAGLAAAQAPPLVVALAGGESRVEDREAVAEAGAEARHGLRREADLGDEDDRAAAALQRRLDRGQVDLGLAGAGDAVQELAARGAGVAVERGDDRGDRRLLLGQQLGTSRGRGQPRAARARAAAASCGCAISSRCSSRRSVWRSEPTAAASSAPDISPLRSASSTARCLTPSRLATAQRRLAGGQDLGPQLGLGADRAARRCRSPAAAPAAGRARASSSTRGRPRGRARPAPAAPRPRAPRSAPPAAPAAARRSRRPRRRRRAGAAARTGPGRRCRPRCPSIAAGWR